MLEMFIFQKCPGNQLYIFLKKDKKKRTKLLLLQNTIVVDITLDVFLDRGTLAIS